jgi:hypothetical protein
MNIYLEQVDGPGGFTWRGALGRNGTGVDACELFRVEKRFNRTPQTHSEALYSDCVPADFAVNRFHASAHCCFRYCNARPSAASGLSVNLDSMVSQPL